MIDVKCKKSNKLLVLSVSFGRNIGQKRDLFPFEMELAQHRLHLALVPRREPASYLLVLNPLPLCIHIPFGRQAVFEMGVFHSLAHLSVFSFEFVCLHEISFGLVGESLL